MLAEDDNNDCIICFDEIKRTDSIWVCPRCNIEIHKNCFDIYNNNICPHCRYNINIKNIPRQIVAPYRTHNPNSCDYRSFMFIVSVTIPIGIITVMGVIGCILFIIPEIYLIFNHYPNTSIIILN